MREAERLSKKYRHLADDLSPLADQLQRGETPGDQIQGTGYTVYKVRLRNRDSRRGKSGGYRVVYYLYTPEFIYLIAIYVKSEREDISKDEIHDLVEEVKSTLPPENE